MATKYAMLILHGVCCMAITHLQNRTSIYGTDQDTL